MNAFNFLSGFNPSMLQGLSNEALAMGMNPMPDLMSGPAVMQAGLQAGANPVPMEGMDQAFGIMGQLPGLLDQPAAMMDPSLLAINPGMPRKEEKPFTGFPFSGGGSQPQGRAMAGGGGLGRMNPMAPLSLLPMAHLKRR